MEIKKYIKITTLFDIVHKENKNKTIDKKGSVYYITEKTHNWSPPYDFDKENPYDINDYMEPIGTNKRDWREIYKTEDVMVLESNDGDTFELKSIYN